MRGRKKINDVAEQFARPGSREYAHAGSGWYRKETAYSYAEPIAKKLAWTYNDRRIAWVTSQKFSVTTSAHTHAFLRALGNAGFRILRSERCPHTRAQMLRHLQQEGDGSG